MGHSYCLLLLQDICANILRGKDWSRERREFGGWKAARGKGVGERIRPGISFLGQAHV